MMVPPPPMVWMQDHVVPCPMPAHAMPTPVMPAHPMSAYTMPSHAIPGPSMPVHPTPVQAALPMPMPSQPRPAAMACNVPAGVMPLAAMHGAVVAVSRPTCAASPCVTVCGEPKATAQVVSGCTSQHETCAGFKVCQVGDCLRLVGMDMEAT